MVVLYETGDMLLITSFFFYFLLFGATLISPDLVSLWKELIIVLHSDFLYVSLYLYLCKRQWFVYKSVLPHY